MIYFGAMKFTRHGGNLYSAPKPWASFEFLNFGYMFFRYERLKPTIFQTMVKSVLFLIIFSSRVVFLCIYGQITMDMPGNFVHLQARNGHKALIYEDSTEALSIELRYGFPKKYQGLCCTQTVSSDSSHSR